MVALSLECGAAVVTAACGGTPFSIDEASSDATAETSAADASGDVPEAADDGSSDSRGTGNEAAADATSFDAANLDAGDVHDAPNFDAGDAHDAGSLDAANLAAGDARDARDANDVDARPPFDASGDGSDAAPAHCGGAFACAPLVPTGWAGPFELSSGMVASLGCGASFSGAILNGNAGLTAPPAACGCSCAAAPAMPCPPAVIDFYASSLACSAMGATPCATTTLNPGVCTTADALATCDAGVAGVVMNVPASTPTQGTCTPLPKVTVPPYTWTTSAHACGSSGALDPADCPAGNVCAPSPAAPFLASLCVEQAGDVACPTPDPSTGYSVKHVFYGGVDDQRGCSACTCAPVVGTCSVSVDQYGSTDGGCSGMPVIYQAGHCQPVQQPADLELALTASLGSCASTLTTPTGTASPVKPMTFCCLP